MSTSRDDVLALSVRCPWCYAPVGQGCSTFGNEGRRAPMHSERRRLARRTEDAAALTHPGDRRRGT
jgi:hypothetical protein